MHAGVGHCVPIPSVLLTWLVSSGKLMAMNKNEMRDLVAKEEKQEANDCSKSDAALYNANHEWEQNIHARVMTQFHSVGWFLL